MEFETLHQQVVEQQRAARGIWDERILRAMAEAPREQFLPRELAEFACQDSALPIGEQQTISQPLMVAIMAEALEVGGGDVVLDVETGSGYAVAVLSRQPENLSSGKVAKE